MWCNVEDMAGSKKVIIDIPGAWSNRARILYRQQQHRVDGNVMGREAT